MTSGDASRVGRMVQSVLYLLMKITLKRVSFILACAFIVDTIIPLTELR
jgi:hypothetical protein